ncbi:Flavin prenyltransferase PAD1 [Fusarium oxysporum f. sp. albedinis]|nr:Flavin prenyltransferase PAD1 [Fusarium oxysporum f. sp. albedinis]
MLVLSHQMRITKGMFVTSHFFSTHGCANTSFVFPCRTRSSGATNSCSIARLKKLPLQIYILKVEGPQCPSADQKSDSYQCERSTDILLQYIVSNTHPEEPFFNSLPPPLTKSFDVISIEFSSLRSS